MLFYEERNGLINISDRWSGHREHTQVYLRSASGANYADSSSTFISYQTNSENTGCCADGISITRLCILMHIKYGIRRNIRNISDMIFSVLVLCIQVNMMFVVLLWVYIHTMARHIFQACPVWIYTQSIKHHKQHIRDMVPPRTNGISIHSAPGYLSTQHSLVILTRRSWSNTMRFLVTLAKL